MNKKYYVVALIIIFALLLTLVGCNKGIDEPSIWNNQSAYAYAQALGYDGTLEEFIQRVSGHDGIGIDEISISEDGELIIGLNNGEEVNLGDIRGPKGEDGKDGKSPHIGENGNWWIGETDTGVPSQGTQQLLNFYPIIDGNEYAVGAGKTLLLEGVDIPKIYLGKPVTRIIVNGFKDSIYLKSITIPDSITTIGSGAFSGCSSLESISIPSSATTIGTGILTGCTALETLTAPFKNEYNVSNNSYLRYYFGGTAYNSGGAIPSSLKTVLISNKLTTLGDNAFSECENLTSITIPNSLTSIGSNAFFGCWSLTNMTIPESVTTIGESTFFGCQSLSSITIPNGVTSISKSAFEQCVGLTNITIPNSVTVISESAFKLSVILTNITIPESVTTIGDYAFSSCLSLTSITVESETPPSLESTAFINTHSTLKIYVPSGSVDDYKGAPRWSEYADKIFAIED